MLQAGGSDRDFATGVPWPLPRPSPLTLNPGCRRAFLPRLLVRWAGPARGKGRGWRPPCAGEEGRGHSWATSGPSAEGPNGTEGGLSSRAGKGGLDFFSPRVAREFRGNYAPHPHDVGLRRGDWSWGWGWNLVRCFLAGNSCPYLWLRWLNASSILIPAVLDGVLRSTQAPTLLLGLHCP